MNLGGSQTAAPMNPGQATLAVTDEHPQRNLPSPQTQQQQPGPTSQRTQQQHMHMQVECYSWLIQLRVFIDTSNKSTDIWQSGRRIEYLRFMRHLLEGVLQVLHAIVLAYQVSKPCIFFLFFHPLLVL